MASAGVYQLSAAAVAALGLAGVGLVLWLEPQVPPQAVPTSAARGQPAVAPTTPAGADSAALPAPVASPNPSTAGSPPASGDPAVLFVAAIEAARQAPQPPPPPGVANARSLPEAFEAMRAAQGEPRPASAGISPFGAPAR